MFFFPLRTSVSAWLSVPVLFAYLAWTYNVLGGLTVSPTWSDITAKAGLGLIVALPVISGISAWEAHRFRQSSRELRPAKGHPNLTVLLSHVAQPVALVVLCYLLTFTALLASNGMPAASFPQVGLLLSFAGMTFGAACFGYILGSLMHPVLASPLAIFAVLTWAIYPSQDGVNLSWRNMSGFYLWDSAPNLYTAPAVGALVAPALIGVAFVAAALLLWPRSKRWASGVLALLIVTLSMVAANSLVVGTRPFPYDARPQSELECTTKQVEVCLWPEVEQVAGDHVRAILAEGFLAADANGLGLPPRVTTTSPEFVASLDHDQIPLFLNSGFDRDAVLRTLTEGIVTGRLCSQFVGTEENERALWRARFGVALMLGLDLKATLPFGPGGPTPEDIEQSGVTDVGSAKEVYLEWTKLVQKECAA